jgi:pseudouridine synthase
MRRAPRKPPEAEVSSPTTGVRLQKALADAGVGPRRDCEQLVFDGHVRVNGKVVRTLPHFIEPARDFVEVRGEPVDLNARAEVGEEGPRSVYVLLNKPKGVITATRDPGGRRNVLDFVPRSVATGRHLKPVGRLDGDSTGLMLLTDDEDLVRKLSHPKFGLPKEYRVTVAGLADDGQMEALRRGMYLITPDREGARTTKRATMESARVVKRIVDRNRESRTLLSIVLREAENREIRRMLARVGLKVRAIEQIAIGPLRNRTLKPGETKLLGKREVQMLRDAALS